MIQSCCMETRMRLPLIAPADLTAEQRALYEDMRKGIETKGDQGY